MNEANTKYLFKNFSFFKSDKPITESLMRFGFACGDGWFRLVKELYEKLQAPDLDEQFEVIQVKEKLGGLRFYTNISYTNTRGINFDKEEQVNRFIREAEEKSFKTCEDCGKPGKPNSRKFSYEWISTLCRKCRKKV